MKKKDEYFVYFIYDGWFSVKIGYSDDYEKRIKELQAGNPLKLYVVDAICVNNEIRARLLEKALHKMFESEKMIGEWFKAAPVFKFLDYFCTVREIRLNDKGLVLAHTDEFFEMNHLPYPEEYETEDPEERVKELKETGFRLYSNLIYDLSGLK